MDFNSPIAWRAFTSKVFLIDLFSVYVTYNTGLDSINVNFITNGQQQVIMGPMQFITCLMSIMFTENLVHARHWSKHLSTSQ